jgi:hypothetical protein
MGGKVVPYLRFLPIFDNRVNNFCTISMLIEPALAHLKNWISISNN